ncbi:MAG TPA: Trk system potassium transporter TrkA [Spirochaetia bacterium]|nr:Trk system potassium transporter TrkA [Spirochaetales bacterium]HRS66117.1 Trk system potassium transporter TrkA [Spirochaetia bacterium]HOT59664.1 Trk system potassium transporter TrkA [Spirochaetales bacterium]HPD80236.1 Trk system potassium transporter TrkA [Spirochaetales bacterium]HQG39634.1 Trk system potassium transporter TrkA [Spirochaetales bacterium]
MKIIIVGAGKIGTHIAQEFIKENRDVVLIEKDTEIARIASNNLDCLVINEDGTSAEVLKKAGIAKTDWFLALTGSDESNIVSCGLVSAEYPEIRTVARVKNPFYTTLNKAQKEALGLDIIINPAKETATEIKRIIEEGFAESIIPLHEGQLQLRLIKAQEFPGFCGKTLQEIKKHTEKDFLIAAVVNDGDFEIPSGSYMISESDMLYVLGTPSVLDEVLERVDALKQKSRRIVIIGATSVTERLIESLLDTERSLSFYEKIKAGFRKKITIQVLDASRDAGKAIVKKFPEVDAAYGDCSEENFLEEMQIQKADLVITATESQTFNILTAQLVKSLGAKKAIAITLNDRYLNLAGELTVDALISVKNAAAASILSLIRRGHIKTIHSFYEADVEIVELTLDKNSHAIGKSLKELALPRGTLVAFVINKHTVTVPTGDTMLHDGDTVALVVRKNAITKLEAVFGGSVGI